MSEIWRSLRFDESQLAIVLVALFGTGLVVTLAGAPTGDLRLMGIGASVAAVSAAFLLAAGWVDAPILVALSLPLPALYSTPTLRVATALPVTAIAVGAWVMHLGVTNRPFARGFLPIRATVALAGAFLLAALFTQHPLASARETVNFAVLLLFLLVATDAFSLDPRLFQRTMRWLVGIAALCGILALLEATGVIPGEFPRYNTAFYRAALGFGQPNGLGLFFAILLPFAIHEYRHATQVPVRLAFALALICITIGLFATFSRGAWLAILAGTIVLTFTGDGRMVVRVWLGALVAAALFDVVSGGLIRDTIERSIGDWVIEQRAVLMLAGVVMLFAYPLTGVGPGGYAESLEEFGPQIPQLWDYLPTPHNAYVQMAAETGIIGLFAFVGFFAIILVQQIRRIRAEPRDAPDPASRQHLRLQSRIGVVRNSPVPSGIVDAQLQRTVLWSIGIICAAGMVVWPFAHGTGQAVMLVLAGAFAGRAGGVRSAPDSTSMARSVTVERAAPRRAGDTRRDVD
ncbi:MAG: O-antigen ligase family protein [Longimicrobiales bacterium]